MSNAEIINLCPRLAITFEDRVECKNCGKHRDAKPDSEPVPPCHHCGHLWWRRV